MSIVTLIKNVNLLLIFIYLLSLQISLKSEILSEIALSGWYLRVNKALGPLQMLRVLIK